MKYEKFVLGTLLLLGLAACSKPPSSAQNLNAEQDSGIVGGQVVKAEDSYSKSVVGLYTDDIGDGNAPISQLCTGTLIAPDVVMTAAHCLDDTVAKSANKFLVAFGNHVVKSKADLSKVQIRRGLVKRVHPRWRPEGPIDTTAAITDIALLKFEGRTPPAGFKPVAYASAKLSLHANDEIQAYGYGLTMDPGNEEATDMMKTSIHIQNPNYSPSHFEAYEMGKSTCSGDSGGPAFMIDKAGNATVVGVTSFGPSDCSGESYFTNVAKFASWVASSVKSLAAASRFH